MVQRLCQCKIKKKNTHFYIFAKLAHFPMFIPLHMPQEQNNDRWSARNIACFYLHLWRDSKGYFLLWIPKHVVSDLPNSFLRNYKGHCPLLLLCNTSLCARTYQITAWYTPEGFLFFFLTDVGWFLFKCLVFGPSVQGLTKPFQCGLLGRPKGNK